jgi:hypothetical protein
MDYGPFHVFINVTWPLFGGLLLLYYTIRVFLGFALAGFHFLDGR